ncbi:hypothetical protein Syun_029082 [Stephania yunnanensis]|uniref:Uncharacterized protein n=1 Tax=Stephania yunnanensis TaxID=152371 RepID=A0AAP0E7Y5_9MAGN
MALPAALQLYLCCNIHVAFLFLVFFSAINLPIEIYDRWPKFAIKKSQTINYMWTILGQI